MSRSIISSVVWYNGAIVFLSEGSLSVKGRKGEMKGENEWNKSKFDLCLVRQDLLKIVCLHKAKFRQLA